jgi:hypothetical protein
LPWVLSPRRPEHLAGGSTWFGATRNFRGSSIARYTLRFMHTCEDERREKRFAFEPLTRDWSSGSRPVHAAWALTDYQTGTRTRGKPAVEGLRVG